MSRFNVWVGNSPSTTDSLYSRLIPTNCRRQDHGMGAAQFTLMSNNDTTLPEVYDDELDQVVSLNQIIRIEDTEMVGDDLYERTIWCGYISSIIKEPYLGTNDAVGTVYADEIGKYYDQLELDPRWIFTDEDGRFLQNPPDFNPMLQGVFYPNKLPEFNRFITDETLDYTEDNIWTINDIISLYVTNIADLSYTANEAIGFLNDKINLKTYPAFDRKSLSEILTELLPKPLTWRFTYGASDISQGVVELVIETELFLGEEIDNIPAAVNVGAIKTASKTDGTDSGTQSFTINETSIPYDEVVIRGKPILVCGSMTPWDALDKNTLAKGWSANEESMFIEGLPEGTAAAPGGDSTLPLEAHTEFRKSLPNVYQKFDFLSGLGGYNARIFHTLDAGSTTEDTGISSFFPFFQFSESNNYYAEPLALKLLNGAGSSSNYSTPNVYATQWENELPIYRDFAFTTSEDISGNASQLTRLKPMVWAPVHPDGEADMFWTNLVETTLENKCQLDYHNNGFYVRSQYPQMLAWETDSTDAIYTGENEVAYKDLVGDTWASDSKGLSPASDDAISIKSKSHWSRLIFTVAGRSDQNIEFVKRREVDDIPVEVIKRKVIDTDYECWFVHKGTVVDAYQNDEGDYSLLNRITSDKFTRNDMPKLIEFGESVFNYLSKVRNSFTIEYQMMNYDYSHGDNLVNLDINRAINQVEDIRYNISGGVLGQQNYISKSIIKSVEYIFNETTPVIIVSSDIPSVPLFTRLIGDQG